MLNLKKNEFYSIRDIESICEIWYQLNVSYYNKFKLSSYLRLYSKELDCEIREEYDYVGSYKKKILKYHSQVWESLIGDLISDKSMMQVKSYLINKYDNHIDD